MRGNTLMPESASIWQRTLAGWLGQQVKLSAVPWHGATIQGRLVGLRRDALLVQDRQAWWLVNAARLNWIQLPPQGRTVRASLWRGPVTPSLWAGVLADWVFRPVTLRLTAGELVPARLLAGDDTALLADRAGVHWVKCKLPDES